MNYKRINKADRNKLNKEKLKEEPLSKKEERRLRLIQIGTNPRKIKELLN